MNDRSERIEGTLKMIDASLSQPHFVLTKGLKFLSARLEKAVRLLTNDLITPTLVSPHLNAEAVEALRNTVFGIKLQTCADGLNELNKCNTTDITMSLETPSA